MKRAVLLGLLLFMTAGVFGQGTGYVRLEGLQFKDENGDDFYPVIMNYGITITYNTYPPTQAGHLDINPHPHQGTSIRFESTHYGPQGVLYDFEEIAALGFNTIRMHMGLKRFNAPIAPDPNNPNAYYSPCHSIINGPLFTFDWFIHSYDTDPNINAGLNSCFAIEAPYSADINVNTNMALYLLKVEEAILLAEQAGLKVILLTADGFELFNGNTFTGGTITNQQAVNDYTAFLQVLTAYFAGNTTIMAYDLDNEPGYKDGDHGIFDRKKKEICDFTAQLYDAVKQVDPFHLITLGLGDHGTIINWDPEAMKTDFVSLHFYPLPQWGHDFNINTQAVAMQNAINRLNDQIYWATQHLQRPWILEETGFTSTPPYSITNDWNCYGINGDYAALAAFINNLLPVVKNCGASGLAWWNFQDSFDSDSPSSTLPCDPPKNFDYREKCWGLIKKGDPANGDYLNAGIEKLTRPTSFKTFNWLASPSACSVNPPSTYVATKHYYDPFLNNTYNTQHTNAIEGYLKDAATNQTIEGALVMGYCWLKTITDNTTIPPSIKHYHYWNYTFTDENGYYKIIPFNYDPVNFGNNIVTLVRAVAPGSEFKDVGAWEDVPLINSVQDFYLDRSNFNFDNTITALVAQGVANHFKAWNKLTLISTSQLSGISDLAARQEVNLTGEVHITNTAEVHIYTIPTFPECTDYTGYRITESPVDIEIAGEAGKEIYLTFIGSLNEFSISVYPVPNTGAFTIELLNRTAAETSIIIRNLLGEATSKYSTTLGTIQLNLSGISKGVYFIEAKNNNSYSFKKLIIN